MNVDYKKNIEESSIRLDSLLDKGRNWKLQNDSDILDVLTEFSKIIIGEIKIVSKNIDTNLKDIKSIEIDLENNFNQLNLLGMTKFMQNKLQDDVKKSEVPVSVGQKVEFKLDDEKIANFFQKNINDFDRAFMTKDIQSNNQYGDSFVVETLVEPRNFFIKHKLPHIIGSSEFHDDFKFNIFDDFPFENVPQYAFINSLKTTPITSMSTLKNEKDFPIIQHPQGEVNAHFMTTEVETFESSSVSTKPTEVSLSQTKKIVPNLFDDDDTDIFQLEASKPLISTYLKSSSFGFQDNELAKDIAPSHPDNVSAKKTDRKIKSIFEEDSSEEQDGIIATNISSSSNKKTDNQKTLNPVEYNAQNTSIKHIKKSDNTPSIFGDFPPLSASKVHNEQPSLKVIDSHVQLLDKSLDVPISFDSNTNNQKNLISLKNPDKTLTTSIFDDSSSEDMELDLSKPTLMFKKDTKSTDESSTTIIKGGSHTISSPTPHTQNSSLVKSPQKSTSSSSKNGSKIEPTSHAYLTKSLILSESDDDDFFSNILQKSQSKIPTNSSQTNVSLSGTKPTKTLIQLEKSNTDISNLLRDSGDEDILKLPERETSDSSIIKDEKQIIPKDIFATQPLEVPAQVQAPEPQPELIPEPQPEPQPELIPEPQPELIPEPQPEPVPDHTSLNILPAEGIYSNKEKEELNKGISQLSLLSENKADISSISSSQNSNLNEIRNENAAPDTLTTAIKEEENKTSNSVDEGATRPVIIPTDIQQSKTISRASSKKISNLASKLGPINLAGLGPPPTKKNRKAAKKNLTEDHLEPETEDIAEHESTKIDDPNSVSRSKSALTHATKNRAKRSTRPRPPSAMFLRTFGDSSEPFTSQSPSKSDAGISESSLATDRLNSEDLNKDTEIDHLSKSGEQEKEILKNDQSDKMKKKDISQIENSNNDTSSVDDI